MPAIITSSSTSPDTITRDALLASGHREAGNVFIDQNGRTVIVFAYSLIGNPRPQLLALTEKGMPVRVMTSAVTFPLKRAPKDHTVTFSHA